MRPQTNKFKSISPESSEGGYSRKYLAETSRLVSKRFKEWEDNKRKKGKLIEDYDNWFAAKKKQRKSLQ